MQMFRHVENVSEWQDLPLRGGVRVGSILAVGVDLPRLLSWGPARTVAARHTRRWAQVFDHLQSSRPGPWSGWTSSYDGRPLPRRQMQDWLRATLERIKALEPRRVLEVGCGAGRIARALAPDVESYLGLDISPAALDALRAGLRADGVRAGHVDLRLGDHEALARLPGSSFDCIVVNSVVQYLPNLSALQTLLDSCGRLLAPFGAVFLGDIRDLRLQEAFAGSLAAYQQPQPLSPGALWIDISRRLIEEPELLVAPGYFAAAAPWAGAVDLQLKPGRTDNELFRFRYDVVLRHGPTPSRQPALVFRGDNAAQALVRALGRAEAPFIRGESFTDLRISPVIEPMSVKRSPRRGGRRPGGFHPARLFSLGARHGYRTVVSPAASHRVDRLDVLFQREASLPGCSGAPAHGVVARGALTQEAMTNMPLAAAALPRLRTAVGERLGGGRPILLVDALRLEKLQRDAPDWLAHVD
jgi:SAM-dependent methyltransferase